MRLEDACKRIFDGSNISLGKDVHWRNSSDALCKYMRRPEYLYQILHNKAIAPRYVVEPLGYLGLTNYGIEKICFPMTCFCDIPLTRVTSHMEEYGPYGIGLDKASLMERYKVQPIQYVNSNSPLADDFREAFIEALEAGDTDGLPGLVDYLLSSLLYMKPVHWKKVDADGNERTYVYQDECEWRYVPSARLLGELPLVLSNERSTERARDAYSDALQNHRNCWLRFEWSDVRYVIVQDETEMKKAIGEIRTLEMDEDDRCVLMSKIETRERLLDFA